MGAIDRGAELREQLGEVLARQTLGGAYGYDIGPAMFPAPQGLQAGYMILISCRSPVLRPPRLAASGFIPDGWPTGEQLEEAVKQCLLGLAAARKRLLAVPSSFQPATQRQQGGNHLG